ncbi:1-deoxy-D-xylulose-5-phosphate reductoisomerase [Caloramator sp. E03]|uniref:1-deoxy-D-xylulose-5-phosphate reductoisomerase n=1 Tax=Caloramator sp. E03 TaxID=2576307 RepID=UPI001110D6D1|nr:1-deoxy-D-xylulose-5-phosphate reductoisomerase [Caloramator sp. E03]QCX32272.1 1-deoxy-D-xylulose-5-phosphate reductoisomerase [Caloramator sp. E03]
MKKISILGSTGSIGKQTIDIIRKNSDKYKILALSANTNIDLLYEQALEFNPKYLVVMDEKKYSELKLKLSNSKTKVLCGVEGLEFIASLNDADIILNSVVGMIGLKPTIASIRAGKTIALANKETLVVGGEIIKRELKDSKASIIPVDSEHNAIFQCIKGENISSVRKLILTASGGPFRGMKKNELKDITPEMALKHPRWNMGKKISIDSATLMNKALEVIEAHYLFNIDYNFIDVVIHPQSIIHSMVEYIDGSIIAQLSKTDMRHPIQYALDYPNRYESQIGYLNLFDIGEITFEKPDYETFECLKLGLWAAKTGGSMPAVLNAANEEAVNLFLNNKIKFLEIAELIKKVMENHNVIYDITVDKILEIENYIKEYIKSLVD